VSTQPGSPRLLVASRIAAIALVLLAIAPALADDQPADVEVKENVVYGKTGGEELSLHLATPKNLSAPTPAIAYIHGGGWRQGSKDGHLNQIKQAARQGYVSISIGYRFAPAHRFPAQVEDVKCAIRWLRAHADQLHVDPQRIGAIGFSAGAHLSMMLGVMDSADGLEGDGGWPDQSSKVQAVVAYFGPTNFESIYPSRSVPILEQFLGGTRQEKPEVYKQASPITYVNAGDAPMLLFHGTKDILVPYEQAFEMATALTKAGVPGRVELLLGAGHGWREDGEMQRTQAAAMAFFDQYLKNSPPQTAKR
jgi:acetyl esterase/lipase